ncbi:MAG: hypothetical protein M0Z42_15850 [Actinomycetota bacterium]|nr:hypothetical protein [Actinomycetota bacterium]
MAFREVSVTQVKEVLRRWLREDEGLRRVAAGAGVDRKTARRYVDAAVSLGLDRSGGEDQLTDELIGGVCEAVRPARQNGHGAAWETARSHQGDIQAWVDDGHTVAKIGDLLRRRGVEIPERTLQRFCVERCGAGKDRSTVRVADGDPGKELQGDFGRMGIILDPHTGRRRVVHALIVVAVYSRHMFVWLTFGQTTGDVIAGLEAAWSFFGGVFPILIPDNLTPVITKAEPTEARINDTFMEYAQDRGFLVDAARVRRPTDKPRAAPGAVRAWSVLQGRGVRRPGRRPAPGRGVVCDRGRHAHPRHDTVPTGGGVRRERAGASPACAGEPLRRPGLLDTEGPPGPPRGWHGRSTRSPAT